MLLTVCLLVCFTLGTGQVIPQENASVRPIHLHGPFSEAIGNFSVELLFHTMKSKKENLAISPISVWTVLAVTAEGALGRTRSQLTDALRITRNRTMTRTYFQNTARWLLVNTTTIQLARYNGLFVDESVELERDLRDVAEQYYTTTVVPIDFRNGVASARSINRAISQLTKGRIPKLVDSNDLADTKLIITSALYFKGQWTAPFNVSSTTKRNFYDSNSVKIGEVNMMYNRFTYPYAYIKKIKARVIELPYGSEDRLSMLIMLPNPDVSVEEMFLTFKTTPLDTVFAEMKLSREEYGENEVDCFIPRFKIDTNLDLTHSLQEDLGIYDLFDQDKANLGRMTRMVLQPLFATKVIHKAEIEVTEEGTTASAAYVPKFANRIGVVRFEADRPFSYLIIEKVTNTVVFGGIYQQPILY